MFKWIRLFGLSLVLISQVNVASANPTVTDPMKYAEADSKSFAEGDTSDSSGWAECVYDESQADAMTIIECNGDREILVHGGHRVKAQFVCRYVFSPDIDSGAYYLELQSCD